MFETPIRMRPSDVEHVGQPRRAQFVNEAFKQVRGVQVLEQIYIGAPNETIAPARKGFTQGRKPINQKVELFRRPLTGWRVLGGDAAEDEVDAGEELLAVVVVA